VTYGSLFSGIGGIDLGLDRAGLECRWQIEIDKTCREILEKHWPGVKRYDDIRAVTAADLEPVDLLCGGFPCQDLSQAGKRAGIDGSRSGLWAEFARLIGELRPAIQANQTSSRPGRPGAGVAAVLRDIHMSTMESTMESF
jgi:DNA (cytosine-5)-methyltransferase 1